uniref:C2H2-type domain-containing protein n=1 Tax=Odontella aurita TaxID=265563 RepID=A0A7S4KBH8_9STRA|mmetsp:Transcript_8836/g.26481  ORF Transcript_8836/g.26481 Transcript_8836/m.26481 type:complete len:1219 (+) Transcript_8836:221-3877(+)
MEGAAKGSKCSRRAVRVRRLVAFIILATAVVVSLAVYAASASTSSPALWDPALLQVSISRNWISFQSNGVIKFLIHVYRTVTPKEKPHASAAWFHEIFRKRPRTGSKPKSTEKGERASSPLHLALLAEASSGVSQPKKRVGRTCHPETGQSPEGDACESELEIDIDDDTPSSTSCSDVEIRPEGALESVHHISRVSGLKASPVSVESADVDGTFAGMVLQVLPAHIDQLEQERSMTEASATLVPGRVGGSDVSTLPRKCIGQQTSGRELEGLVQYELVELIRTHLGLVDVHSLDYMYKPVFGLPQNIRDQINEGGEIAAYGSFWQNSFLQNRVPLDGHEIESETQQSWRWPWLFASKKRREKSIKEGEDEYERMGDRAFAGGSHGEVWRARRRCPPMPSSSNKHSKATPGKSTGCDPMKELVMKRLKLEHGLELLEAGLREVYFGELLVRETEGNTLFTKYVDHFFREVPSKPQTGSPDSKPSVELWLVFEDGGPSLRSYLYTSVDSGDFYIYTHSPFWRKLRMSVAANSTAKNKDAVALSTGARHHKPEKKTNEEQNEKSSRPAGPFKQNAARNNTTNIAEGRALMKEILKQVLTSSAYLHSKGIIHRDIKPSNIMCKAKHESDHGIDGTMPGEVSEVNCVLGDFSSAWDEFSSQNIYGEGPSADEQTEEYAPPEVLFGPSWVPFHPERPQSYDSWSIGVVALEMLLGTPNVFSVDQRTSVVLTHKMKKKGASSEDIRRALYLAALSQFCIYIPSDGEGDWPLREGDPLHGMVMAKTTCTLQDFHTALRARDPLGIGFDSSSDRLLQLIWGLLSWDPMERLTPSEALEHIFFNSQSGKTSSLNPGEHNAVESQTLDPRVDMVNTSTEVNEFVCPKCGKRFADHSSCQRHTTLRRHAKFCAYERSYLQPCLNAHSMLPAHPTSGYCDIQGRRKTIEDFHTVHLSPKHQFYGVFDGHNGNLASKYAASLFYDQLVERLSDIDDDVCNDPQWKDEVEYEMVDAFRDLHEGILRAVEQSPGGVMGESGTTATALYVTENAIVVSNVGDSRAVLSRGASFDGDVTAIQLTVDHVASNSSEKILVEERGGFVSSAGGIDRVNGTLAVSRSLGDATLAPVLSRVPHVVAMSTEDIKAQCKKSDQTGEVDELPCFIVLASDGLWDVMSNQEVVDLVVQAVRKFDPSHSISWDKGGAFQEAAQLLTQEAYVRGSTDNIGVCVVAIV